MSFALLPITSFGLGYMRPASGTWGSLPPVALLAAFVMAHKGPASDGVLWYGSLVGITIFFSAACLMLGNAAERHFRKKDPSQVVADETAGMALTLLCLPWACFATQTRAFIWLSLAFVLFRLADIIKPPPAHKLQRLHAGPGILIDDLLAGVYAGALSFAAAWLFL